MSESAPTSVTKIPSLIKKKSKREKDKDPDKDKKHKSTKHKKRKTSTEEANFNIPGVQTITLSEETQKFMQLLVGEQVTAEKPWKKVKKELFEDHLELHEESSIFLPLKEEIMKFPKQEILVGYVPDESRDYDEFYLCLSEAAEESVGEIIEKIRKEQEERLKNSIFKTIRPWKHLGSGKEVQEEQPKTNRELLQVEVESDYPVMYPKVRFKLRKVGDARDGYVEILSLRQKFNEVVRRRIDGSVQASPEMRSKEAQTICTYPKNVYTQYEYSMITDTKTIATISVEMHELLESIFDALVINFNLDLYSDDYTNLIDREKKSAAPEDSYMKEYTSFTDINYCRNKMINSIVWHPMWSGIVAIAYGNEAPTTYLKQVQTRDETQDAVHGINPVLLWSFVDGLNAKLLLEAHREVRKISWCPYDENILVGGCVNGQVIIWDITNKLKNVEAEEVLTIDQAKYRVLMHSLMNWMKNIHDLKVVRATAVSDSEYSHRGAITGIEWMPCQWEVSKTGKLVDIHYRLENTSLQFLTSSEDGSVCIWDLRSKPTVREDGYKPQRKLRRLKKKPATLTAEESPYKILNRRLVPTYQINFCRSDENDRKLGLSHLFLPSPDVVYTEADPNPKRKFNITDRIIYKRVEPHEDDLYKMTPELFVGSVEGELLKGSWEGFDFNSGELVNSENAMISMRTKSHDGPISTVGVGALDDILLTVGGNIFCLWKKSYPDKPILWRRSRRKYTHGEWNKFRRSMFCLTRDDGNLEVWQLLNQSHVFGSEQTISGQTLTSATMQPLKMQQNIIGIADYNGSLRMFYLPFSFQTDSEEELKDLKEFFNREEERKKNFVIWQKRWREKNKEWIEEKERNAIALQKQREEDARALKKKQDEEKLRLEIELQKQRERSLRPPPGQYKEWAAERFERKEEETLLRSLLNYKHLNKEVLEKEHAPVKKFEEEKLAKKLKQEQVLQKSETIFNEKVAAWFPDALKKRKPPPEDPYEVTVTEEDKTNVASGYVEIEEEMRNFVDEHPFVYKFDWREIINAGKMRRKMLDNKDIRMHTWRYDEYKYERQLRLDAAEAERTPRFQKVAVEREEGEEDEEDEFGNEVAKEGGEEQVTSLNVVSA